MVPKPGIHQMPLKKSFDFQAGDKKEITITSGDISPQYLVVSVEKNVSTPHIWCWKGCKPACWAVLSLIQGVINGSYISPFHTFNLVFHRFFLIFNPKSSVFQGDLPDFIHFFHQIHRKSFQLFHTFNQVINIINLKSYGISWANELFPAPDV